MNAAVTLSSGEDQTAINTMNVWLVEDNSAFRQTIAELINETEGMRCSGSFVSCEEALAELRNKDAPEVVLMDIGLPGMSGIEGVKHLKKISPSTDVIVLTIYDDDEKVFRAICNGATGYLLKDAPAESIIAAIHDVLQGGAPIKKQIAEKLFLSFFTIDTHLKNIYLKLHVHSRTGAVAKVLKERLL